MNEYAPWLTLVLFGAYHGLNPGMGWLFAVAPGLQEQRRAAVAKAFAPIAVGHAASITAAIAIVVYEKVGLAVLRRAWFNLDKIWAGALCGAGLLTLAS